ncbi:NAD(P)-dependent alcohol dehydrogenase [Planomicrobium sp. CPCC 101079]|uniref:NAD(P)-dependent alcohol dehydrogenase n=1 Tax=Planomicrobium sp. CPCC 101079 TaxID=2599618 RepID=UPI0011B72395|nr:NAD(P)-dependent alcohol dehydrogenase [Planomicrobium sp. CPCC 101079]TWT01892.1 NAD(P)-dependent alcohol dehydrogenase [Planomicrobium sp. CPCC 101079]
MKASVHKTYGPPGVMELREVEKPMPKDDEVLIKVYATTATTGDCKVRRADPFAVRFFYGMKKPKIGILGSELSGEVEATGKDIKSFKKGDFVFCGTGGSLGANAEYVCIKEKGAIAIKPDNMTFEEAASVPFGATTSLFFLRDKGHIREGQKVLVYGASGGLGTYAVQLAKSFGTEVTAVCSTGNIELVKSLGADWAIDYTKEDFTESGKLYDLIFDTVGKTSFSKCRNSLKENGIFLAAAAGLPQFARMMSTSVRGGKKLKGGVASMRKEDLLFLKGLIEAGKIKSVIDRSYPLDQVAAAHSYVETGHKHGSVVITLTHPN